MKYENEIEHLNEQRARVYDLDYRLALLLAASICFIFIQPILGFFIGLATSHFLSKKVNKVVKMPCPRCKEPFGKVGKFVISIGPNECQNCKLLLSPNPENHTSKTVFLALSIIVVVMGSFQIYLWSIGKMNDYGLFLGVIFIVGAIALAIFIHKVSITKT